MELTLKEIIEQIEIQEKQKKILNMKIWNLQQKINSLNQEMKKFCKHKRIKIVNNDYEDKGTITSKWQEKVCKDCGKVLARSNNQVKVRWIKLK